jgi:hypothetical protein
MLDFFRNFTKSEVERLDERISAYLDGALPDRDRERLERRMAGDPVLRAQVRQMRAIRQAMRRLPRQRAPRNFTLDPAQVGQIQPEPAWTPYPILRSATVIAALLLAMLLVFDLGFYRGGIAPVSETAFAPEMITADEAAQAVETEPVESARAETVAADELSPPQAALPAIEEAPAEAEVAASEAAVEEEPLRQEAPEAMAVESLEQAAEDAATGEEATESAFAPLTLPEDGGEGGLVEPTPSPVPTQSPPAAALVAPTALAPTVTPIPLPTVTLPAPPPTATPASLAPTEAPVEGLSPVVLAELVLGTGTLLLVLLTWFFRRRL